MNKKKSKKSKVWHLTYSLGGGLERSLRSINDLDIGFEQSLVSFKNDKFRIEDVNNDKYFGLKGFIHFLFSLKNNDKVIIHSTKAGFLRPLIFIFNKNIYYMPHSLHSFMFKNNFLKFLARSIEYLLSIFTYKYLILGWHEKRELLLSCINKKSTIVKNPFSFSPISKIKPIKINNYKSRVVILGRIHPQKNPSMLVDLLLKYPNLVNNFDFIWIGSGNKLMKKKLNALGVKTTGWVNQNKINEYLINSDVYLHLAVTEGFPYALLESIISKKCILLFNANYNYFIDKRFVFKNIDELNEKLLKFEALTKVFNILKKPLLNRFINLDYRYLWKNYLS